MGRNVQYITFSIVYGIMIFIWTFVYLNKSKDKVNESFLGFLTVVILWMVLSISIAGDDISTLGLVLKTIYFYSMLNMAVAFLLFIYRFIGRKLDGLFYMSVTINTLTILARYLFPIDYADPTFWRLTDPVVAPVMSALFSLPAVFALMLIVRHYKMTRDGKLRTQLRFVLSGTGLACLISIVSEYILPAYFGLESNLSLMYFAILIFIVYIFRSIIKFKFLNIQSDYVYRRLFLNSGEGILIINRHLTIVSINNLAKEILENKAIEPGDKITQLIKTYDFDTNYKQQEITIVVESGEKYLTMTQHPIDPDDRDSTKLLVVNDITSAKLKLKQEKELLMKRSSIDPQTGFFNKQYMLDYDKAESPELGNTALLFIDIDNFKSINDLYGHLAGDSILKSVAECIRCSIGSEAQVIRFGGDEFVVIFANPGKDEAYLAAEAIRTKVNALNLPEHYGDLTLSLSIGLAEGRVPVRELITQADEAMYSAKSQGKNRTMKSLVRDVAVEKGGRQQSQLLEP
ncbi:sensor domain-containing diguanylate cyclase [Desulfitobacterium hafniense]|uniref:GGDEF domain-containing protein n=2 Tax=root TaxID=1 RepID=Q24R93_DESHY|nr:GGDEF domain-containing protein [Desulfitobacterium hafniense]MEA5025224.1 GGDEF domain-containing protein [Desulfitobacterium hafniense]BAE85449.1 hypothetical protein DSY3660 [Desulfitobacterium hafniense Y51]